MVGFILSDFTIAENRTLDENHTLYVFKAISNNTRLCLEIIGINTRRHTHEKITFTRLFPVLNVVT